VTGTQALAAVALVAYTAIVAVGGWAFGRLDRKERRARRAEWAGRHRSAEQWPLGPADVQEIPHIDLGDVLSHKAKGNQR
jgi:hypothetical protein